MAQYITATWLSTVMCMHYVAIYSNSKNERIIYTHNNVGILYNMANHNCLVVHPGTWSATPVREGVAQYLRCCMLS